MSARPANPGRVATVFVIKLVVLTLLAGLGEAYLHRARWGQVLQDTVAAVAASLARVFADSVERQGNEITAASHSLVVTLECTALFAQGLFCAAVVAFPATWRVRAAGVVVGVVGVAVLNVLRVAGLILIAIYASGLFYFSHLVLMQWFLISCVAPLWLAWAVWAGRQTKPDYSSCSSREP